VQEQAKGLLAASVGLLNSMVMTLTSARRNRVQAEIAEAFNVSQPTVSRVISRLTPVRAKVLADRVPRNRRASGCDVGQVWLHVGWL